MVEALGALACPAWDVPLSRTFPDLPGPSHLMGLIPYLFHSTRTTRTTRIHGATHSRTGARPEEDLLADAIAEGPWEWMRI